MRALSRCEMGAEGHFGGVVARLIVADRLDSAEVPQNSALARCECPARPLYPLRRAIGERGAA